MNPNPQNLQPHPNNPYTNNVAQWQAYRNLTGIPRNVAAPNGQTQIPQTGGGMPNQTAQAINPLQSALNNRQGMTASAAGPLPFPNSQGLGPNGTNPTSMPSMAQLQSQPSSKALPYWKQGSDYQYLHPTPDNASSTAQQKAQLQQGQQQAIQQQAANPAMTQQIKQELINWMSKLRGII